ncbi:uncharacterized protein LOC135935193 [Cloeon dipterum]|uniref:uncharacterized protein LOC135935193 n=1 Tax=Cloeon dipterum TaxID=197152 RepID=UPI003220337B
MLPLQFVLSISLLLVFLVHAKVASGLNTTRMTAAMIGDVAGKKMEKNRGNTRKGHVPDGFEKFEIVDGKNVSIPVFYAKNGESWKVKCPAKKSLDSQVIWTLDKKGLTYPYTRIFGDCNIYCVCSNAYMSPKSFDLNLENMMSDLQGTYTCRADSDATWSFFLVVRGEDQCHPNIVFYVCIGAFIVVLILALLFVCCIAWSEKIKTASTKQTYYSESPRCSSIRSYQEQEPCVVHNRITFQDGPPYNQSRHTVYQDESPSNQGRHIVYKDELSFGQDRRITQEEPCYHSQQPIQMRNQPRISPRYERRVSF